MKTYALILCGGQSSRMGFDKCLIEYHERPQYAHLYEMLSGICDKVFISCREDQSDLFPKGLPIIKDHPAYKDHGPLTALLSAFEVSKKTNWLVVGCDYPFLTPEDLKKLIRESERLETSACYVNALTGFTEPLIACYHPDIIAAVSSYPQNYHYSLRQLLMDSNATQIRHQNPQRLRSVDTPEDVLNAIEIIRSGKQSFD